MQKVMVQIEFPFTLNQPPIPLKHAVEKLEL